MVFFVLSDFHFLLARARILDTYIADPLFISHNQISGFLSKGFILSVRGLCIPCSPYTPRVSLPLTFANAEMQKVKRKGEFGFLYFSFLFLLKWAAPGSV